MTPGLGDLNSSLVFSAIGSALGIGAAGMAAVGAWKKAFSLNKAAPFIMVAFVGAPLSQTFYGFLVRDAILKAAWPADAGLGPLLLGTLAGIAIGLSAWIQGKIGAKASDALGETGKGFANYLMAIGIIETVAIFVMVFVTMAMPKG
ncbi:MAG: V-type ATP synthase subunit K [Acidobacteriota bacterium]|nr:V-type ATP synthase subunit K [Acidobacteriota bacterium]